jgi:hypothetical protein
MPSIKDQLYLEPVKNVVSEKDMATALRNAYKLVFNKYCSNETLSILMAHVALETGRFTKQLICFNIGNIKRSSKQFWTMYRCSEILDDKEIFFDPPHPQTHFRAYKSLEEAAKSYILFLLKDRYEMSLDSLMAGKPKEYAHNLKINGYYTGNEAKYTAGVVSLSKEYLKKIPTYGLKEEQEIPVYIEMKQEEVKFTTEEDLQPIKVTSFLEFIITFISNLLKLLSRK